MNRIGIIFLGIVLTSLITTTKVRAQKIDEERMLRDMKVAENVLATMIKQKFEAKRMFFPLSVASTYQDGVGITFILPADYTTPIVFLQSDDDAVLWRADWSSGEYQPRSAQRSQIETGSWTLKDDRQRYMDSVRDASNEKIIEAGKEFLADYGDILSQVRSNEKLIITNEGDQPHMWIGTLVSAPSRIHLSIELSKGDLTSYKAGKLTRQQLLDKIKVTNAVAIDTIEPDLELLSTIFNRLYRPDLSKTFFTEGNIYYERLKDFGAVFYMQVFSSNRTFGELYDMPTIGLHDVNQQERDKKVTELYPLFEKELKENIIEYGRTLKCLGDKEALVFNVRMTQCDDCKIPGTLEISIPGTVLQDYNAGKLSREATLGKIELKKGVNQ